MRLNPRFVRRAGKLFAALCACHGLAGGCLDSEVAVRFRNAYVPGLMEGLSTAVSAPGQSEDGLRRAWSAMFDGLSAALMGDDATAP